MSIEILSKTTKQTLEQLAKLPPLCVITYSADEENAIVKELLSYAKAKQENIPQETLREWCRCFSEMRLSLANIVMRIRVAKNSKRFGNQTEFAQFMDIENLEEQYYKIYKHELKQMATYQCDKCNITTRLEAGLTESKHTNCSGTFQKIQ